jgi:hypothetical protein
LLSLVKYLIAVSGKFKDIYLKYFNAAFNAPILSVNKYVNDIPNDMPLEHGLTLYRPIISIPMRLELLAIIRLITENYGKFKYLVVALPTFAGDEIKHIVDLFPDVVVLHFGMNNHKLSKMPQSGYNEYDLIEDAFDVLLEHSKETLLVCDKKPPHALQEEEFIVDLAQEYYYICKLQPYAWMCKIRFDDFKMSSELTLDTIKDNKYIILAAQLGLDLCANYSTDYPSMLKFLKGDLYINAYGWYMSTQTILCGNTCKLIDYNCIRMREKLMYYNSIERGFIRHQNKHINPKIGFDYCGDCALESYIWEKYNEVTNNNTDVIEHVNNLTNICGGNFFKNGHGMLYSNMNSNLLSKMFSKDLVERSNVRTGGGAFSYLYNLFFNQYDYNDKFV